MTVASVVTIVLGRVGTAMIVLYHVQDRYRDGNIKEHSICDYCLCLRKQSVMVGSREVEWSMCLQPNWAVGLGAFEILETT